MKPVRARHPQTLAQSITLTGHGLHSNVPCTVSLRPVDSPTGIRFVHKPTGTEIAASADRVGDLSLATTLTANGIRLGTVEHLLSALAGLEIEHVQIEVDGTELPILDGSAAPWVEAILKAGVRILDGHRRFMKILRTVEVQNDAKWIRVSPHADFRVRYSIAFDHPSIGRQAREVTLTPEKYMRELGAARTFCLERDIDTMRSMGLALGGNLENAVVYGAEGPLNDALRFEDEAVRHKMLDLVGDLALLGAPLMGLVEAHAAGHAMHVALAKAILSDPTTWTWSTLEPVRRRPLFGHGLQPQAIPA